MRGKRRRQADIEVDVSDSIDDIQAFDYSNLNFETAGQFFKALASILVDIKRTLVFQSEEINSVLKKNEELTKENSILKNSLQEIDSKYNSLEKKIDQLEFENDLSSREKNRNNIVFAGLPVDLENPQVAIMKITNKINANIQKEDILDIQQVKQKKENLISSLYVVKFKQSESKAEIINKKKAFKHLFTSELGFSSSGGKEIFVRQHLTNLQKNLYYEAKKLKEKYLFRFLWVKNGEIFLRKDEKTKIYNISKSSDIARIENIFKNSQV